MGTSPASAQVPPLVQFSNVAMDEKGNSLSGVVSMTFSLYNSQQDVEPLWAETQNNVQLDPTGHYSVQLGITKTNGVPTALFSTGQARWLGVQISGQGEQPRVLLFV
jgi:ribulose 1,5-bisphosphate synthetase/thiazole synthase